MKPRSASTPFAQVATFALLGVILAGASWAIVESPMAICAALVAPLILRVPVLGLLLNLSLEGTRQILLQEGLSNTLINVAQVGSLALGALGALYRARGTLPRAYQSALVLLVGITAPGLLLPGIPHPVVQSFIGISFLLTPIMASVVGLTAKAKELQAVALGAVALIGLNAYASVRQQEGGVSELLESGYRYGEDVRQIGGHLRAFGYTATDASLGMLAAALCMAIFAPRLAGKPLPRSLELAGFIAAGIALVNSTSRSSLVLLGVFFFITAGGLVRRARYGRPLGVVAVLTFVGLLAREYASVGADQSDSLYARFDVWRALLGTYNTFFGLGAGSVGAASFSQQGAGQGIFTDNSWISIYLQFGVLGAAAALGTFVVGLRTGFRWKRAEQSAASGRVLLGITASAAITACFIELLDYSAVTVCMGFLFGSALHRVLDTPEERRSDTSIAKAMRSPDATFRRGTL